MASLYFDTIHYYFPIISKQRFYSLMNPLSQPRADVALLVLCMRLTTLRRSSDPMISTPEYFAAKKFYAAIEGAGTCSTQVLQSGILIAFYEFGHAIYPAAFLSVGTAARYGVSFGMNVDEYAELGGLNWIEVEEKKRTWWAVLILDRYLLPLFTPFHARFNPVQLHEPWESNQSAGNTGSFSFKLSPNRRRHLGSRPHAAE